MSSPLLRCLLLGLTLGAVAGVPYSSIYDNVNLDQVLTNDRLLNSYVNCLLDRGRCNADGLELKRDIPDALQSRCAKCSARQRDGTDKVIRYLANNRPQLFQQLEQKYDPTGYYRQHYGAEAASRGIRV